MSSFIDDLIAGDALLTDIDDYVERWHSAYGSRPAAAEPLHEFLGMSWPEYQTITEKPYFLRFVAEARTRKAHLEDDYSAVKIAARGDSAEAREVYDYLKRNGRLD